MRRVLTQPDLKDKGIKWSRQHIHRLVRQGKFPRPFKLGERTNAWFEDIIDRHLEEKMEAAQTG